MRLDWDRVVNADPKNISTGTYKIIDKLQQLNPAERLLCAAVHMKLLVEVLRIDPSAVMSAADNLMASPEGQGRRPEFVAAKSYMEHETR